MAQTSERKHWDDFWAASRDRGEIYSTDMRIVKNLRKHVSFSGLRVLEVGAGTGRDSSAISADGADVYALDYSEGALKLMAESPDSRLLIVCGDARAMPFRDGSFDVVFHQGLLEHFREPMELLKENYRVLKRGGILLVDVPQRFHYYTILKHLLMFFGVWFAGWETEFSLRELRSLVKSAGLTVIDVYGENLSPPIWYRGLRKIFLKFGLRLPMYPWQGRLSSAFRNALKRAMPQAFYINTAMVIGAVARKE
jgi:SAM-dependent methyltransferase